MNLGCMILSKIPPLWLALVDNRRVVAARLEQCKQQCRIVGVLICKLARLEQGIQIG
jgi:hypothetical protein